jgi:gas vesicle structural protein
MFSDEIQKAQQSNPAPLICHNTASVSLCEIIDRILSRGVLVAGEVTISVAGVDLLTLDLNLLLACAMLRKRAVEDESVTIAGVR